MKAAIITGLTVGMILASVRADWRFDAETGVFYDSNLSNSDRASDEKDDWAWESDVRVGNGFQLSRDLRLNVAADLEGQAWDRFRDFDKIGAGASASLRYRFGLGSQAPLAHHDDADRALETALDMSEALDELNRQWEAKGRRALDIGIGINTDIVVAGNMGSRTRLNYTVIGDGVNLASRLEELTKTPEYAARIIVSHSTLSKATGRYQTRRLGEVAVKGKQNTTEIYAVLGREV